VTLHKKISKNVFSLYNISILEITVSKTAIVKQPLEPLYFFYQVECFRDADVSGNLGSLTSKYKSGRYNMKKKLLAAALVAAMSLSLVACGGGSGDSAGTSGGSGSDTATVSGSGDDTLAIGISNDVNTLIPWQGASEWSDLVYEALGGRQGFSGDFYGILMESYEQVDELTYDVTIYDNIYDSEGNHITAEDVAFSWQKCQELGELTETRTVASIEAVDEFTTRFTWGATPALGDFEAQMSNVKIVSKAAYEASDDDMATKPVGTGRYVVSNFDASVSITLDKRDDYWQSEDKCVLDCQKAPVQTVRYDIITESSQISNALRTGTIDASADVSVTDAAIFESDSNYTVEELDGVQGYVMYPNCSSDSKLADENLRKAVFYAIDKEYLTSAIQGGACDVLYAMGSQKYNDYDQSWSSLAFDYDVDKAKEYLAKSNYSDGCELTLITPPMGYNEDVATIIATQLAEIGITLKVDVQDFPIYLGHEGDQTAWDFTIAFLSSNDYITNCWAKYFDVDNTGTGLTKNFISDSQLQSLIDTCTSVDGHTPENNTAFWSYVMENAYCCPLICPKQTVVYNSNKISEIAWSGFDKFLPSGFELK
jgi:ABC-type transport system substrate-binding protein